MKKRVLSIVGAIAAFGAVVAVLILLIGGGANSQFSGLRCDVDKPEGDYELAAAVADFDDLMPVASGAFIFEDGATVDVWAVDPEYWGGEEHVPGSGEPSTVYALSSGEVLLEVCHSYSGYNLDLVDKDVVAAGKAFIKAHPVFEVGRQLSTAYNRLKSAIDRGARFEFQTIDQWDEPLKPFNLRWSVSSTARIYTRGKLDTKEIGRWCYTFDPKSGEFIGVSMSHWE